MINAILRAWFMAHAPVEPWAHFVPNMAEPHIPSIALMPAPKEMTETEKQECDAWREDMMGWQEMADHRVREALRSQDVQKRACDRYRVERDAQRVIQWPRYYADHMIDQWRSR